MWAIVSISLWKSFPCVVLAAQLQKKKQSGGFEEEGQSGWVPKAIVTEKLTGWYDTQRTYYNGREFRIKHRQDEGTRSAKSAIEEQAAGKIASIACEILGGFDLHNNLWQEVVLRYKKLQKELTDSKSSGGDNSTESTDSIDKDGLVTKLKAEKQQALDKLKEVVQKYKWVASIHECALSTRLSYLDP